MTMTYGLLVFAFAYILMGVGPFLETIRRPHTRFVQQGGRAVPLVLVVPALLILVSSIDALRVQSETTTLRQQAGLPPNPPPLMDAWVATCFVLMLVVGITFVVTELILTLRQRMLRTSSIAQP